MVVGQNRVVLPQGLLNQEWPSMGERIIFRLRIFRFIINSISIFLFEISRHGSEILSTLLNLGHISHILKMNHMQKHIKIKYIKQ